MNNVPAGNARFPVTVLSLDGDGYRVLAYANWADDKPQFNRKFAKLWRAREFQASFGKLGELPK